MIDEKSPVIVMAAMGIIIVLNVIWFMVWRFINRDK